jgi:hypothetical protein
MVVVLIYSCYSKILESLYNLTTSIIFWVNLFRNDSILVLPIVVYHTLILGMVQRIWHILVLSYNNFMYDQIIGIFYTVVLIYYI